MRSVIFNAAVLLVIGVCPVGAQAQTTSPNPWSNLQYRHIGPVGNRTDAIAGVPGNPLVYYAGAASGGVWKTTDGGVRWEPIFDTEDVQSIGALAVAPSDPNIVWAGTGEPYIRSNISIGDGMYKSTDGGKTWTHMGLNKTGRIARVLIDSRNSDVVLACALGTAYGPQPDRGVFRTTDGGKSWEKVLFVDENTGCSDLAMDPNNPRILFAGMWQIVIHTWGRTSGGPASGLFRSDDEGSTWKRLEGHGLPHSPLGRIGLAIAKSNSNRIYALIETGDGVPDNGKPTQGGELWRSDDGGENWQLMSYNHFVLGRTHYFTRAAVEPDAENVVYFLTGSFSQTLDGGHTVADMRNRGAGHDNHDMWIDPTNGNRMAVANDYGVILTVDRGQTWDWIQLPLAQMYHVTVDHNVPYFIYGNEQDNSSYRGPSNSLNFGYEDQPGMITRSNWISVGGSESGFATPDPVDSNIVWSSGTGDGSLGGAVTRLDLRNRQVRQVEVWPESTVGFPAAALRYRFNWTFPLLISPHDHNKIYVGSQYVHVTTDGGNSWQVISPDLTRNDKTKQGPSGGLTQDNLGVEYEDVVFSLAESPKVAGLLWAGTNDGLVQLTRDAGKTWTNLTANIPNLPPWGTVSSIVASRHDPASAYITVDFHQQDNRDPFVYKTNDYGKTWTAITNGVTPSMCSYAHAIAEDPVRKGLLFLGTENAAYVSFDDGGNWQALQMNLPHAPVYGMTVQEHFHDLVLATYGRGFWILDDITPLEQLTSEVLSADAYLFKPRDSYRFREAVQPDPDQNHVNDPNTGQNPPYGADINYFLKSAPEGDVRIVIQDAAGHTVRTLDGTKQSGINRVWWDLRSEPTREKEIRLRTTPLYEPWFHLGPEGWRPIYPNEYTRPISVLQPPGTYTVKLEAGGQEFTQKLTVLKDPHSAGTEADITANTKLVTAIATDIDSLADAINQAESIRGQIAGLDTYVGNGADDKPIRDAAAGVNDKIGDVENGMYQTMNSATGEDQERWPAQLLDKLTYLANEVADSDFAPTIQAVAVQQLLHRQLASDLTQLHEIVAKDVTGLNAMLRKRGVANIISRMQ